MIPKMRFSLEQLRQFTVTVVSIGVLLFGGLHAQAVEASPQTTEGQDRPNIIYILVDDLGYGDVGAFGQTKIKTPQLDLLADEGMRFTEHYAGSTVCAPSRAALVTGKHTGNVQIRGNYELGTFLDEEEFGQMPLHPGTETIGTMMQDAGYKTALIGKWGLGGPGSYGTPNKQGFDYFFGYLDQKQAHNHYPSHLWLNEEIFPLENTWLDVHQALPEGTDLRDPKSYASFQRSDHAQTRLTDDALRYIKTNKDDPFFLYLAYAAPHAALQVPDEELTQYSHFTETPTADGGGYLPHPKPRAARAGMISRIDSDIGKVIALLRELELDENTLVIFSSDNGPSFEGGADLDFFDSNGPLRGYKRDLYEGGIRMPTIAWWPGKVRAGSSSSQMTAIWDIMPTIADATGAIIPDGVDGISLLPTLLGSGSQKTHDHLYWEFHAWSAGHSQAVRFNDGQHKWKAVRVYTQENRVNPPIELYDLASDLGEQKKVASQHPALVEKSLKLMKTSRSRSRIDDWNFDYWPAE